MLRDEQQDIERIKVGVRAAEGHIVGNRDVVAELEIAGEAELLIFAMISGDASAM